MTIKQIFNLILIFFGVILVFSYISLYNKNEKQETNIEYLRHNFIVKDQNISDLKFSNEELSNYIKFKDSKHKIEIDSILKSHDVKIKNLLNYQKITINTRDTDTILVPFKDTILKSDSMYHLPYNMTKDCNYISGEVITKDKNTKLYITEIKNNNEIFITKSNVKSFWDKIFFRKGKEIIKVSSKCGEINYQIINIVK